jgi:pimeloyl-ACP methyl ester carboxylesterase
VAIWNLVGPRLARSYRVVAYDQRGHGGSDDAADLSFEALAADCAAVAARVHDPVVVGHSWGASVVLHCAAAHDVRGVVCVDGGVIDMQADGRDWPTTERLLTPPHIEGREEDVVARLRSYSQLPWDAAEAVVRRSFRTGPDGIMRRRTPVAEHMKIVRHMWEDPLTAVHAAVACPVLVVLAQSEAGDERARSFLAAKQVAADALVAANARVTIEWIESIHDVPLAHPDELTRMIERFAAAV